MFTNSLFKFRNKRFFIIFAAVFIVLNSLSTFYLHKQIKEQLNEESEDFVDFQVETTPIGNKTPHKSDSLIDQNQILDCNEMIQRFPIPYARNYTLQPVTIHAGSHSTPLCAVPCIHTPQPFFAPDAVMNKDIYLTMESSVYYPASHPKAVHERGVRIAMTPRLDSDVPVGYFSYAEYEFVKPIKESVMKQRLSALKQYSDSLKSGEKIENLPPLAIAVISNCAANTFRLEAVRKLQQAGVSVSAYGHCFPESPSLPKDWKSKMDLLEQTPFTLAFENSFEQDYVTEKYLQALVAGSIPIVIGADNIFDFDPIDEPLQLKFEGDNTDFSKFVGGGLIRIPTLNDIPSIVKIIQYLSNNPEIYQQMINFKTNGLGQKFTALVDMAVVHSECRLCIHLATKDSKLKLTDTTQNFNSAYKCSKQGHPYKRVLIRERGRFYFENLLIPLDKSQLKLDRFFSQVKTLFKFQAQNVQIFKGLDPQSSQKAFKPIWEGHRKDFHKSVEELKIYKVYQVELPQRDALYSDKTIDSDEKLQKIILNDEIVKLEVIFI